MEGSFLIAAALLVPVIGAALIATIGDRPNLREAVSIIAAALLFLCIASLAPQVLDGQRPSLTLFPVLPGVSLAFEVEPLGLGFALIASLLWLVTVVYAIGYMRGHGEAHQTRFFTFFAVSIAAAIGAALSGNLLTLYLYYEALTLATYPLVTHGGTAKDRAGGRTYLTVLFGTSLTFMLLAIAWIYSLTGTLDFVDGGVFTTAANGVPAGATAGTIALLYALILFGTGKAALMPFHRWLPAAMVAPTPVSALLHAVAVVKLGVFAVLKVTLYTFGLDFLTGLDATTVMQYVAAATLLIAAIIAIRQDNLKRRLAYSTISQLAYIVLAATLANSYAIAGGGLHIAAHAFAKITLFFCAGAILVALHKTQVSELRGAGRLMPITFAAWIVASLSVIGMPLTGGFWSKWYLAQGTLEAGEPLLLAVLLLGSLLAMGYLLPPAIVAFSAAPAPRDGDAHEHVHRHQEGHHAHGDPGDHHPQQASWRFEAPTTTLAALVLTAVLSVALFFAAPPLLRILEGLS